MAEDQTVANVVKTQNESGPASSLDSPPPATPEKHLSPSAGSGMIRPLVFVGSPGAQPYGAFDPMHAPYYQGMLGSSEKALPEPVRKYCIGCGEIVDFASGRARACRQRLCGRIVCMSCYDHALEKGVNMFHMDSGLCAVCEYQNKKRPGGSISYWHSTFHDQEDLEFVRTLRDGLPQVNGLFLEVYGQRQACWRRRVGGIRKHYSFKQHGGYFESRLQSIFQQRESPTAMAQGLSGGLLSSPSHAGTYHHPSLYASGMAAHTLAAAGHAHALSPLGGGVVSQVGGGSVDNKNGNSPTGDPHMPNSTAIVNNQTGGAPAGNMPPSVDISDVLTGTTEEPRCAMCCHFMSDRQQFGIFACQAEYCGRIFCGQCVGEGRAAGIAMFHTNTQMCIICTFQNKMTRLGKKPYIPHTWHFDFFPDRELDVDFLRHLTKALPKVDDVWLDIENLVWRTQNQVFLFAAHGGFLEARWAAIQDAALQANASSVASVPEVQTKMETQ